jgi:TRAP transporter TAXI family solute receptor
MVRVRAALRAGPSPRAVVLGVVLTLLTASGAWAVLSPREDDAPRGTVVITTGQQRGVYYSWATTLARETQQAYPRLRVKVLGSSGSLDNIERVANGVADVGLTTEDATEDRTAGTGLAASPGATATAQPVDRSELVALARVYDDYVHVVVRADGPVQSLADLRGRPVAVGQPLSGVAFVAKRVLQEARVEVVPHALELSEATQALAEREVDAVFWSGGLPTGAVTDLARRVRLRLLPLDTVSEQMRAKYGVAYRPAQIPAGSYGLSAPVATLASPNLLVARRDADPAIVTALLDTMFRRRDAIAAAVPAANALDRRTAISSGSLPLHPAAVEYFRSTKP